MNRSHVLCAVVAFVLGATTVLVAKPKITFDPKAYYAGHSAQEAHASMLAEAEKLAGDDTWERIGVGRVALMSGDKQKAEQLFDSVLKSPKVGKGDIYRVATAYAAAKQWEKAKPLFERAVAMDKDDDTGITKAGCWFNLSGDRARAEELFNIAFTKSPDSAWNFIVAGGSYVGIDPF